ncbi:MFS transporter [Paraburkholderia sp. RP-4-7]|uniref:MFS transporter n=1 Tax=Paraburkholderia polaris TaxID=2728848 RepID=A0A848IRG0_9BURK|nr:MFS transporter [Paraburkholderia polaris]NMM04291.1 MFS transporter [Paraburkholderia polaris]
MFEDLIDNHPVTGRQKIIFLLCLIFLIIDGLDFQLLAFASPVLLAEWKITKAQLAPALAAALLGMSIGAGAGGFLGDRFGCRRTLICAVAGFGATTFASALVRNVPELVGLRFLSGVGFGIAVPTAMSLASEWCPGGRRGQLIIGMSIGTMAGGTIGGLLAGPLIPAFGWRSVFIVSGTITMIAVAFSLRLLPESLSFLVRKQRAAQALKWIDRVMGAVRTRPVDVERPVTPPTLDKAAGRLLSAGNLRVNAGLWVGFFGLSYAAFAFMSWTPTVLVGAGSSLQDAIRGTSIYTFSAAIGVLLSAALLPRLGSRLPLLVAIVCTIVAAVGLPQILAAGVYQTGQIGAAMAIAGVSGGMAQSIIYALAVMAYPASYRATGLGVCVGISRAGGIASVLSGGVLLEAGGANAIVFFGTLVAVLVSGLMGLAIMDRHIQVVSANRAVT